MGVNTRPRKELLREALRHVGSHSVLHSVLLAREQRGGELLNEEDWEGFRQDCRDDGQREDFFSRSLDNDTESDASPQGESIQTMNPGGDCGSRREDVLPRGQDHNADRHTFPEGVNVQRDTPGNGFESLREDVLPRGQDGDTERIAFPESKSVRRVVGPGSDCGSRREGAELSGSDLCIDEHCSRETELGPQACVVEVAMYRTDRKDRNQVILVLSSQCLTDLRDAIECQSDDFRNDVEGETATGRGSGMFFIEGVLYDDLRDESNIRYSTKILEFLKVELDRDGPSIRSPSLPTVQRMESTKMSDLRRVRLGSAQLYLHAGDCEHLLVIQDVRGLSMRLGDPLRARLYPYTSWRARKRRRHCAACQRRLAERVCFGDVQALDHPTFFCEDCFVQFHYRPNGTLRYADFQVFPYHHE
uniref:snRNA-activating protein complex subunit 3 n=1 Tax=Compsopogon caeruleus TaxID=31354 RepID=A0A7S1TCY1_9RHOD